MKKNPGLRVDLDFRFNTNDMEFPSMDFLMDDPKEVKKAEVKIIKKSFKKKNHKELF